MANTHARRDTPVITGADCLGWIARSITVMRKRRDEINSLNVFPVPDSDTGSNMLATLTSAYESALRAQESDGTGAKVITAALAAGAVRGARGNSGTVLSQVFRALAECTTAEGIDAAGVETALARAVGHVSQAIANPVEGTILTVLRHAAAAAAPRAGDDVQVVVKRAADEAKLALSRTPSQLKALRDAGVVDAGGAGLVLLLDALVLQLAGIDTEEAPSPELYVEARDVPEMEVMYLISLADDAAREALRGRLAELGTSLIVAGEPGSDTYMVHVHTFDPGAAIEASFDFGLPMGIRLEVLSAPGAAEGAQPEPAAAGAVARMIIAVAPEGPLAELFSSAGAKVVPERGAVAAIVEAINASAQGTEVVLLPNGLLEHNDLVRVEVSVGAGKRTMTNIATTSLVAGLAALAVHNPNYPLPIDAFAMSEAATGIRYAELVAAAGTDHREGDILTYIDGAEVAVTPSGPDAIATAVRETVLTMLADQGGELVTLLLGDGVDPSCASALREELARRDESAQRGQVVDVVAYAAAGMRQLVQIGLE